MKEIRFDLREEFVHEDDSARQAAFRRILDELAAASSDEAPDGAI